MNKQVVIAGLLSAIAAEAEDPTPCEDFATRAAAEGLAAAKETLEAWRDKIPDLQDAKDASQPVANAARDAYEEVTAAIVPFYTAEREAYEAWQDAINAKSAANDLVTSIGAGTAFTVTDDMMLLGEAAADVLGAAGVVSNAQTAYNDKSREINDATFTHDTDGVVDGYRARLTAEYRSESLMLDAQDAADDAETLAINNYTAQEAVVNALLVIEGCSLVTNADLTTSEESAILADSTIETAEQLVKYAVCCTSRMTTYLDTITQPATGGATEYPANCSTNAGWGMKLQQDTYSSSKTSTKTAYDDHCVSSQVSPAAESCDGASEYTNYRTAYLGAMKAARMQDVVDSACQNGSYDCSNGKLSNSGGSYAYWDPTTDSGETTFHMLNPASGTVASATNPDLTWVYREGSTVNAAAASSNYSTESGLWDTKYQDLAKKLKDWTIAEARYWAYTASWEVHEALIGTAEDSETALKTTKEQKIDLSAAADAQVEAANKRVSMALSDLNDEIVNLADLQTALVAAEEAHAVQVWLQGEADAAAAVQAAIVAEWSQVCGDDADTATCSDALADLEALHETAADNLADVQTALNCTDFDGSSSCSGFYADRDLQAQTMIGFDVVALEDAGFTISRYESIVEAMEDELAAAIAACKGLGYDKAQDAKKALIDLEAAEEEAAAEVAIDYADKSAFADTGETNTLCAYPAKGTDGSQDPRPECSDGYCCGAAQKFLKDGTKLAIETCQKAEGVHTYDYYPPLPEGSPVEPTPETWRFQCISGAQKLAATAAAALAASYMMA